MKIQSISLKLLEANFWLFGFLASSPVAYRFEVSWEIRLSLKSLRNLVAFNFFEFLNWIFINFFTIFNYYEFFISLSFLYIFFD